MKDLQHIYAVEILDRCRTLSWNCGSCSRVRECEEQRKGGPRYCQELIDAALHGQEDFESEHFCAEDKKTIEENDIRESIADIIHQSWAHWMRRFVDQYDDAQFSLAKAHNWSRQVGTPYQQLSEREKDSYRAHANKIMSIIKNILHGEKN